MRISFFLNISTVFSFLYLLLDPAGILGFKIPVVCFLLALMFIRNRFSEIPSNQLILSMLLILFSIIFILKQELISYFEKYMSIMVSTIVFAAFFILNKNHKIQNNLIVAMKIFLIGNLVFVTIGIFFLDIAVILNGVFREFKMFSLESRAHFISNSSFYHNSIYSTAMIIPLLIFQLREYGLKNIRGIIVILCLLSLLLTQSRTIILAFGITLFLHKPKTIFFLVMTLLLYFLFDGDLVLDNSTRLKLSYLPVFWSQFHDLQTVLFGSGPIYVDWGEQAGTHRVIELSYFELLRYFGFVGVFFLGVVLVIYYLNLRPYLTPQQVHGTLIYLGIIFVNPYLWGIIGLPLLAMYLSVRYHDR